MHRNNMDKLNDEMENTKLQLSRKIVQMEDQVKESLQDTKDQIASKVQTIKDATNLKRVVLEHPWWMTGGAVVAGLAVSAYFMGKDSNSSDSSERNMSPRTSLLGKVREEFKPEWGIIKGVALQYAVKSLAEVAMKKFPKLESEIHQVMDHTVSSLNRSVSSIT